jgi:hypothetical protein
VSHDLPSNRGEKTVMRNPKGRLLARILSLGVVAACLLVTVGDRAHAILLPPGTGIDPLDILDVQVKNNVLIVLDTSGSMKWPTNIDNFSVGGDDPTSRLFQAKAAIRAVVNANQTRLNFGLASYNILGNQKTLNRDQDFDGEPGNDVGNDGPFIYVSADASAAPFYGVHSSAALAPSDACTNVDGFFCQIANTFNSYNDTTDEEVWRSFMNRGGAANPVNTSFDDPYPAGCTVGAGVLSPVDLTTPAAMRCRYYIQSRLLRNNVRYTWNRGAGVTLNNRLLATTPITCASFPPPAGPPSGNLLGYAANPTPCFQFQDGTGGPISTFYYTSSVFQANAGTSACGGGATINSVAICQDNNADDISIQMEPELIVQPNGTIPDLTGAFTVTNFMNGDNPTLRGLRADQSTPLGGTLQYVRTVDPPVFPDPTPPGGDPRQRNYVILLTDGDDTCSPTDGSTNAERDQNAVAAAVAAEELFDEGNFNPDPNNPVASDDPRHRAETFVVAFAAAVNAARSNVIAQGGSGANITAGASLATAVGSCKAGATCRNAFVAQNTQQLIDVLNQALSQTVTSGEFSTVGSVFDVVPEYVGTAPPRPVPSPPLPAPDPLDPANPDTRYAGAAFRSYQTTFEMPGFQGRLRARSGTANTFCPGPTRECWEASAQLEERIETDLAGVDHTFAELHGGLGGVPPVSKPAAGAHIDRRIFTNSRNGVNPQRAMLWPPSVSVAAGTLDGSPAGSLDEALGIASLSFAQLGAAPLRACRAVAGAVPPACSAPATQLAEARREAREVILAYTAGAVVSLDVASGEPRRNGLGQLLYRARTGGLLAETTLAQPALVTPPANKLPTVHSSEYLLYRDGPRIRTGANTGENPVNCFGVPCTSLGFGLRNPDRDGRELTPSRASGQSRQLLKPVMSVVYVAANDMLHAFRAGPCLSSAGLCAEPTNGAPLGLEDGGEELWGFVPYDLLPKLRKRMETQSRDFHTYMMASSVRFADVFFPCSTATPCPSNTPTYTLEGVTYNGRWRKILVVGRGIGSAGSKHTLPADPLDPRGGKYYTTLDITAPGPYTVGSLDTQLPSVLWSRGNPDVQGFGPLAGTLNGSNQDATAYQRMGQTWSTPSIARVIPTNQNGNREFVMFTGSGYGEAATQGSTFYTLDPATGQPLASPDIGDGAAAPAPMNFENAIVADTVNYIPSYYLPGVDLPNLSGALTTAAFVGDIHGRVWRFDANTPGTGQLFFDLGRNQPIATQAAMLNLGDAHYFVGTGYDFRVPVPPNGFQVVGIKGPLNVGSVVPGFPIPFGLNYRGTVPPLSTFEQRLGGTTGVVFFVGTRFNPAETQCVSTFDSQLFAVSGATGGAVYDLNGAAGADTSTELIGSRVVGIPMPPVSQPVPNPSPGPTPIPPPTFDPSRLDQGLPTNSTDPPSGGNLPADQPRVGSPVKTIVQRASSAICR